MSAMCYTAGMTTQSNTTIEVKPLTAADLAAVKVYEQAYADAVGEGYNDHSAHYLAAQASGLEFKMSRGRPPVALKSLVAA